MKKKPNIYAHEIPSPNRVDTQTESHPEIKYLPAICSLVRKWFRRMFVHSAPILNFFEASAQHIRSFWGIPVFTFLSNWTYHKTTNVPLKSSPCSALGRSRILTMQSKNPNPTSQNNIKGIRSTSHALTFWPGKSLLHISTSKPQPVCKSSVGQGVSQLENFSRN